ncbi:hypothetical protein [Candidatus Nitrosotenuis cloacae]|uniref:Uncharacterized protein n=1 Tax=Candidatus Nitrosotenuis cloacae TaxID=1603555 RepID=A0A3G1B684_9ARCH|nr:hypothetical protein [Candidatus Nitrosotenuis cloacae]AJZ75519.1 hypothetical protein SU86_003040 [Candidatus Nitrosotenuis cloacae]
MVYDYSGIAIVLSIIGIAVATLSFFLTYLQTKAQRLSSESQFIADIQKEIDTTGSRILELKTKNECLDYVWEILNTLDRLCYFETKGRLQDDIIKYFINYLELGLKYYNWLIKVKYQDEKTMLKSFPYILQTCTKHSINEDNRTVTFMLTYDTMPLV